MLGCNVVSDFATLLTITCQTPLSVKFFRQEYWSGLPFPIPGDPPKPEIEPGSPALAGTNIIQYNFGNPNHNNQRRKK